MDTVFLKLFNMSIAAGWLILAVIVLRFFLRKAPKCLTCILWAVVALRLLCPFTVESTFSLIPSAEILSPEIAQYAQEPMIDSGISAVNHVLNPIINETLAPNQGASANPLHIWIFLAGIVWASGLILMLGYALLSVLWIHAKVRESVPLRDNIRICDAVKSPFILGIIRPQIYLPSDIDRQQLQYVLMHEQAHLKRGDHLWKPLSYVLLSVYWFHPLVWAAYILFGRDIELACDEKVIQHMDINTKKDYCKALLACSIQKKMVIACPPAFGDVGVKKRIKNILQYKKPGFWIMAAGIIVCAVAAACFLTDPKTEITDVSEEDIKIYVDDDAAESHTDKERINSGYQGGDTFI